MHHARIQTSAQPFSQLLATRRYRLPPFQRGYVWSEAAVARFLEDIREAFEEDRPERYLGDVILHTGEGDVHDIVDGGHRFTTAILVFAAARRMILAQGMAQDHCNLMRMLDLWLEHMVTSPRSYARHCRIDLVHPDPRDYLQHVVDGEAPAPTTSAKASLRALLLAHDRVCDFLSEEFADDLDALAGFVSYFAEKVVMTITQTPDYALAKDMFLVKNARGSGLSTFDKLKTLLLDYAPMDRHDEVDRRWRAVFDAAGETTADQVDQFLRYFVATTYTTRILKEETEDLFDWFRRNTTDWLPDDDPFAFLRRIERAARVHANISADCDPHGVPCPQLANIGKLGYRGVPRLVLMAGQSLPSPDFQRLAEELELTLFVNAVVKSDSKGMRRRAIQWIDPLRAAAETGDLDPAFDATLRRDRSANKHYFTASMALFGQCNRYTNRLVKYALLKINHALEARAAAAKVVPVDLFRHYANVQVEHIQPKAGGPRDIDAFGGTEAYAEAIQLLGNLTPFERSRNAALKNKSFQERLATYARSRYVMTRCLSGPESGQSGYASVSRALGSYDAWGPQAISARHANLTALAQDVWSLE